MTFHPLLDLLHDQPVIVFFTVMGLGLIVGKIRVAGIEAGSVTGVLIVGLFAGHLSTAALRQVNALAKSSVPMLGYVGTYTFANVMLTVMGGMLMRM